MIDDLLEELMASFTRFALLIIAIYMVWVLANVGLTLWGVLS